MRWAAAPARWGEEGRGSWFVGTPAGEESCWLRRLRWAPKAMYFKARQVRALGGLAGRILCQSPHYLTPSLPAQARTSLFPYHS